MKLNSEQQKLFNFGIELYELYEREELQNSNPFFATTRMQLYKSVLSLAVSYEVLSEEAILRYKELSDYEELLSSLSKDHPARFYYNYIQNLSPGMKMSIKIDFKIIMQRFWKLIQEVLERKESYKGSKDE
ncbi:hypothetical protein CON18_14850 [Bacillus cereus]|uniref:hypothetical protein n=1 Tax=Bacillus cereus TaxID=1396 RepID=UPI000BEBF594|nr:hypothetical protein [Bacillus cereus]PDZ39456.1 hypothetical protein CON18_14850 [Bacillus cereus]PGN74799.1 hypothetical protein CN963_28735 [Bacillus cereus]